MVASYCQIHQKHSTGSSFTLMKCLDFTKAYYVLSNFLMFSTFFILTKFCKFLYEANTDVLNISGHFQGGASHTASVHCTKGESTVQHFFAPFKHFQWSAVLSWLSWDVIWDKLSNKPWKLRCGKPQSNCWASGKARLASGRFWTIQPLFTPSNNLVLLLLAHLPLLFLILLHGRYNLSPINNEGPVKAATRVERRGGEAIGSIPAFDSPAASPASCLQLSLLGILLLLLLSAALC